MKSDERTRTPRPGSTSSDAPPQLLSWVLACALAEVVGMSAAAFAAHAAPGLPTPAAVAAVLGAGLVEGLALGLLQGAALDGWVSPRARRGWVVVTVCVAGLGWAAGSIPTVATDSAQDDPPALALVLLGAAGIGLVMGALMGAAQALVLRDHVRHPGRWLFASACGWALAMTVIFGGATLPSATWSTGAVTFTGAVTGLVAGAALGFVTGAFLPSLDGQPVHNRVILWLLASRFHRRLDRGMIGLGFTGARTGRTYRIPVRIASSHDRLIVMPGHHERKTWWRNIARQPHVSVLRYRVWCSGVATLVFPGELKWLGAYSVYHHSHPRATISTDTPFVLIDLQMTVRLDP